MLTFAGQFMLHELLEVRDLRILIMPQNKNWNERSWRDCSHEGLPVPTCCPHLLSGGPHGHIVDTGGPEPAWSLPGQPERPSPASSPVSFPCACIAAQPVTLALHWVVTSQALLQHVTLDDVCSGSICVCFLV